MQRNTKKPAFSLVELVVVIVIIGILAAIAIPRLSRGSSGAGQAALSANLTMVRNAINLYAAEHNNTFPGAGTVSFADCLTKQTDINGGLNPSAGVRRFGPYLAAIPPCPVGENAGKATAANVLIVSTSPPEPDLTDGAGWVYNPTTGEFRPNTNQTDDTGKPYKEY